MHVIFFLIVVFERFRGCIELNLSFLIVFHLFWMVGPVDTSIFATVDNYRFLWMTTINYKEELPPNCGLARKPAQGNFHPWQSPPVVHAELSPPADIHFSAVPNAKRPPEGHEKKICVHPKRHLGVHESAPPKFFHVVISPAALPNLSLSATPLLFPTVG